MALRLRQLLLLPAAFAVAIIVAGCGGDDGSRDLTGEPFTEQNQMDFTKNLDQIGDLVAAGDCDGAQSKLDTLTEAVGGVPSEVDQGLKDDLIELLGRLGDQIQSECEPVETSTSSTDTTEEPTTTDAESTTTTTTTTTSSDTTETEPPETSDEQGTPPGQGGTPPGQGGNSPGQGGSGTPPGQEGNSPGQGGSDPGSGGVAPRQGAG